MCWRYSQSWRVRWFHFEIVVYSSYLGYIMLKTMLNRPKFVLQDIHGSKLSQFNIRISCINGIFSKLFKFMLTKAWIYMFQTNILYSFRKNTITFIYYFHSSCLETNSTVTNKWPESLQTKGAKFTEWTYQGWLKVISLCLVSLVQCT